jgi:Tol biopolymer transport system component
VTRRLTSAVILVCAAAVARPATQSADVPEPKLLTNDGGRVSWYQGDRHDLIAFDAVVDKKTQNTELFVISPDGSGRRCVSCNAGTPKGFVGQPSWHPDGEHLVIQVENRNSDHKFYNHMSWGIDSDLWLITRDGKRAQKIWETPKLSAALHPHFSPDGRMLVWSERVPTGKKLRGMIVRQMAPGGENQWTGWRIHIANVDVQNAKLSNHRTITPNGEGFYETHGIRNGRLLYSATKDGANYVDDVYEVSLDGGNPTNLTNSPDTWDEHGQYSAKGDLAFISSRVDKSLKFPGARPANLRTELFVRQNGTVRQITNMNQRKGKKIAVSDYDWDRDGRRIAFQVASLDASSAPEIWMVTVR